jgi:hypothetical protein
MRAAQPLAWATMAVGHAQVAANAWSRDLGPNPAQYCATFIQFSEFQFSNLNYINLYMIPKFIEICRKFTKMQSKFL